MEPDSVASAVAVLDVLPDVGLVWGDFAFCDHEGNLDGRRWSQVYTGFRAFVEPTRLSGCHRLPAAAAYGQLLQGLFLGTSSIMVRRTVIEQIGGFDETLLNGDDRDLWLRMTRTGTNLVYRDRVTYRYRTHPSSISNRGYRRVPAMITVLERQLPHVPDGHLRRFVQRRVHGYRLALAYGLREAGLLDESRRAYRRALAERVTWAGLRGLLRSYLARVW